jgi:hypothetical protein
MERYLDERRLIHSAMISGFGRYLIDCEPTIGGDVQQTPKDTSTIGIANPNHGDSSR